MTTKVTPLGIRLFLEGIEVPVISSQVNIMPDQPSTASIQVIPSDMGLHLLPRTLVHLFYLDDELLPDPPPAPRVDGDNVENNLNRFDAPDEQYKIMFTGEVVGFTYGKNPSTRQLVLQCIDLSSYWDTCYQWFADYSVGGNGLTDKSAGFTGGGKSLFNSVAGGHQWVIGRLLNTKPKSAEYQKTKGLLAGILHLFEAIGGIKYRSNGEPGFNGVNDFFTIAELRYNLLGMIGALEEDETSAKMYANKAFRSWLRNGMTSLGTLLSFRDIINHVNRHIFHHIYPNPCAKYVKPSEEKRRVSALTTLWTDFAPGKAARPHIKKARNSMAKAQNFFAGASSAAGTDFVGATGEFEGGRTAVSFSDTEVRTALGFIDALKSDDKASISSKINVAFSKIGDIQLKVGSPEERPLPSNFSRVVEEAARLSGEASDILGGVLGSKERTKSNRKKEITVEKAGRLFSQLFLPETFFVSPPRCNVFFPDQYFQFSFSRNFMREITRLSCRGGLGMIAGGRRGAALLGRSYFAPNITDVRGKTLFATMDRGASILLPHEVHSGIIPKFEWVADGHRWGVKAAKETGKTDAFSRSGKIGYIQRLANYQFYLHRWSARTMGISGVFNPRVVLGLPGLVMDRSMPAPEVLKQVEARLGRRWMPMQYLGKTASVSHTIHQQGGQTQVQFTHCRTHRGIDDEFLGVLTREVELTKGQEFTIRFKTTDLLDSNSHSEEKARKILNDLKKLDKAPDETKTLIFSTSGGGFKLIIKNREDLKRLVKDYLEGKLHEGVTIRGTKVFHGVKVKKIVTKGNILLTEEESKQFGAETNTTLAETQKRVREVTVEVLPDGTEREIDIQFGEEIEVEVGALSAPENFTFTMERQVGTGKFKRVDRTVEEALTPGWYSDIWKNKKIGEKVYIPLLGCEAITDNISLEQDDQNKLLDRTFAEEATLQSVKLKDPEVKTSKDVQRARGVKIEGEEDELFTFREESKVPGSMAQLQIIPGSIEEAIDALTIIYGMIRLRDGDIHQFIREYTKRPIANMKDILGSQNLEFDDQGNINPNLPADVVEGFHSRAFGDYNTDVKLPDREGSATQPGKDALRALFPGVATGKEVKRKSVVDRGQPSSAIKPELDPRGRARARVRGYVEELSVSRGLLG